MNVKIKRRRSTEETRKLKVQRILGTITVATSLIPAIISATSHGYYDLTGAGFVFAIIGCPLLFSKNIIV